MKQDNYAGAREMSEFVENLWGWQVTVSDAVDAAKWQQVHQVYVEDKYGQDIKAFFNQHNPWPISPSPHACWKLSARITGSLMRKLPTSWPWSTPSM